MFKARTVMGGVLSGVGGAFGNNRLTVNTKNVGGKDPLSEILERNLKIMENEKRF